MQSSTVKLPVLRSTSNEEPSHNWFKKPKLLLALPLKNTPASSDIRLAEGILLYNPDCKASGVVSL